MATIARAGIQGLISAQTVLVLSDRADAAGIAVARDLRIEARVIPWRGAAGRDAFERELAEAIDASRPDLVVLAGFMRVLSEWFVERYAGRMLNIHPSLLPRYRGLHTHRRVLEAGDREHGASVHFVTAELDGGPIALQSRVPVAPADTEASLSARVQATEHIIYPRVIGVARRQTSRDASRGGIRCTSLVLTAPEKRSAPVPACWCALRLRC
jgi:phosphoribosylglycinamide formyltransferase 1